MNDHPTQEEFDEVQEMLSNQLIDLAEQAIKNMLKGFKEFHVFYLAYHTASNHNPPSQTESREVSEVLFNRLIADLAEIETSIFPQLEGFLDSDENFFNLRKNFISSCEISHRGVEGVMNAEGS